MSPTYTAPAIETIRQGEQLLTPDSHHEPFISGYSPFSSGYSLDGPRDRARQLPPSRGGDTYGRKHRSGSPQVHPYLKVSPVPDDTRRASSIPVPTATLRRHASAEFLPMNDPRTEPLGSAADGAKDRHEQKRARLSPSPRRPTQSRSLSFNAEIGQPKEPSDIHIVVKDSSAVAGSRTATYELSTGSPAATLEHSNKDLRSAGASDHLTVGEVRAPWSGHNDKVLSVTTPRSSSSPTSSSPLSSSSSPHSVASSQTTADTELSTIITHDDLDGEETPVGPVPVPVLAPGPGTGVAGTSSSPSPSPGRRRSADPDRYGTPEMPRGPAKLPHIPATDLTPRMLPNQSHPKHLPRAEKLPMSGYELLASTISSSAVPAAAGPAGAAVAASSLMSSRNRMSAFLDTPPQAQGKMSRRHSSASASLFNQPATTAALPHEEDLTIKPIYRRFEALNHRLLLHLQDELGELEEQLHRLDTTDTQTRRLQSSILPASRRAEFLAGGELQWHKTDILSKIAFKLGQYNHTLSSFTSTRDLPAPAVSAVTEYRDYLTTHRPISDVETRFLDWTDDLVTLEAPAVDNSSRSPSPSASPLSSGHTDPDEAAVRPQASSDCYLDSLLHRPDDEPIVKPIPGTMHGNSWLVRHNRLSVSRSRTGSRSSSAETSSSCSPRSARPASSSLEPLVSPRLAPPPSPLRQHHGPAEEAHEEEKFGEQINTTTMASHTQKGVTTTPPAHMMVYLALALAVAVLMPILTFSIVPDFVARMIVVLLVGLSVVGSVAQAVDVQRAAESRVDLVYTGALYGGVMAIVAAVMA